VIDHHKPLFVNEKLLFANWGNWLGAAFLEMRDPLAGLGSPESFRDHQHF